MNKSLVAQLRKQKGWTQEILSEKAFVTVRTIQRVESGREVSLDTLRLISNALDVTVSELFESIEGDELEKEIMDISQEQKYQLDRKTAEYNSIKLFNVGAIFFGMSIMGCSIYIFADSTSSLVFSWMIWVSLLLFLLGFTHYYLNVTIIGKLDKKYPLAKGFSMSKDKEREPIENVWQFLAQFWWIIFSIGGFLSWLIPYLFNY